ncbi:MAG: hypothetical protein HND47_22985 [Chloroflexi bacterium]|nr:hypothetical protein [Chloroflexota bacterium]
MKSAAGAREILSAHEPGETVQVKVLAQAGDVRTFDITLHEFPATSRAVYFIVPSILGAIFLAVSLWIFGFRRSEPAGRAFSLFTSSLAIVTGTYFNLITTHEFTVLWTLACGLAGGALVNLALVFPLRAAPDHQPPLSALGWGGSRPGACVCRLPQSLQF